MSNLSHTIRRFNRFELKYLISLQQAEIFKKALRKYLAGDEHGSGRYRLSSLYYDSPDFRCYWEKVDGVRFRRKLRIRHYETEQPLTRQTPVFVEIKQRIDRVTQKRRLVLPYAQAVALCTQRQMPEHIAAQDQEVLDEVYAFLWQYNLRPTSIVRYQRQAFIGSDFDLGLRVTFDTALNYQVHQLRLEDASSLPMISPDRVIMEIKVNERLSNWLSEMIAAHNLRTVRISKYCRSIELANGKASVFPRLALAAA
ncbi:MAG: polyphosphate polymerase domain-containing protein [Anaerolineales bacterium]|nr:polyphosphate polymerase domain-containing protein [Anaerolineales bacterium]